MDTKKTPPNLNYYYIKPILNVPNVALVIIIISIFLYLILYWNYINTNWENEKCKNSNFFLAPIFGKDSTTTLQQCTADIIDKSVDESVKKFNIDGKIQDLSGNISQVLEGIKQAQKNGGSTVGSTMNNAASILTGIQKNIDNIKTAMSKVLGSVILSSYMSNGIIQSTQNLENTDLVNMVTQYNNVQNAINTNAQNTMPQVNT